MLCAVDGTDRVLKEGFHPISSPKSVGYFDVLVRRGQDLDNNDSFSSTLETLNIGDELAYKGGEFRLNFQSTVSDEIKGITLVGSGSGIAPIIQIVRGILSMNDITVENIEFVWLNEERKDFVLEKELEILELQYYEKFSVTKVLEKGLFGRDLARNGLLEESVSPHSDDRVAVVCAPDYCTSSIAQYLGTSKKYPVQSIAVIDTLE